MLKYSFNPHTHEGCDMSESNTKYSFTKFQSTHPRRVWHKIRYNIGEYLCFNPHTHEGCDEARKAAEEARKVSIHTPTKGVTKAIIGHLIGRYVSIHTPTKGVTAHTSIKKSSNKCFNPHTHEGCDVLSALKILSPMVFQSTHPRRVWHLTGFKRPKRG